MKPQRKIAVELLEIRNRHVGLGEFAYRLASHIATQAAELHDRYGIRFCFIVPRGFKGCFGPDVAYIEVPRSIRRIIRFWPMRMDLCHITHQSSHIRYMLFARRNLLTVHDINFIYEKKGAKQLRYAHGFRSRLAHADQLVYISQFTRKDVEAHFAPEQPCRTIYNGVAFSAPDPGTELPPELPDRFLLHLSSLQPKKNAHLLIEMMAFMPEENLVVVGNWKSRYGQKLLGRIKELELNNIYPLEHVSDAQKAALYARCCGFCFPSLCEGFGLPPIEAMKCGKPVFLSTLTSLPEVGGEHACYYPELTPEAMAQATRQGLRDFACDPEHKAAQIRNWADRFDWEKCADEYIGCYLDLLGIKE
ncbi:MAG: glycosyltransferase family 4 protein [Alistipes sp.]|mgnify:FL=1|jgi:glycosyltransferase involved in cell wall biosynthesis|uniref:glycosyltransferase family 4 protein n=1 Tax=unclassified Alistipes TaxID=2608932 RepID=UPI002582C798|nr:MULTISPECIES: glycosyltransferase family 1 protein [unclassified Alistipes]MCI9245137.1 glycosyltransferase family 4 protein [Alistipes sp.]HUN13512.1 glycosyltransferase family 1 protein [Alistipes sp.]